MLGYLTTGVTCAFAAAVQPGPFQAYLISLTLRHGWSLASWYGAALIASFYATMIVSTAVLLAVFAGAHTLGPRVGRVLVGLSALALAGFGTNQLSFGARMFVHGL